MRKKIPQQHAGMKKRNLNERYENNARILFFAYVGIMIVFLTLIIIKMIEA
jgi:hypothetical protein